MISGRTCPISEESKIEQKKLSKNVGLTEVYPLPHPTGGSGAKTMCSSCLALKQGDRAFYSYSSNFYVSLGKKKTKKTSHNLRQLPRTECNHLPLSNTHNSQRMRKLAQSTLGKDSKSIHY